MNRGHSLSQFYPSVVMNVASPSFQIKKLVYLLLIRFAHQEPDTALLAINTLQKDLNDQNALIRAQSLRVFSSIRVPVIAPLIQLSIRKCWSDSSPFVRKSCANAIIQCYQLDPSKKDSLVDMIQTLLKVLGSAIAAFQMICPDRIDLLHSHYYKLANVLIDSDDWSCIEIVECLLFYCRKQFMDPCLSEPDTDYLYLQSKIHSLLARNNSAVVVSAVRFLFYTAGKNNQNETLLNQCIQALLRCLLFAKEEEWSLLYSIVFPICKSYPHLMGHYRHLFYIFGSDSLQMKTMKLHLLSCLLHVYGDSILSQLTLYTRGMFKCHSTFVFTYRSTRRFCNSSDSYFMSCFKRSLSTSIESFDFTFISYKWYISFLINLCKYNMIR